MHSLLDLTVASYNIHKAVGTDRRRDPARIAAVIAEIGADVVALQEADRRFGSRAGLLDLAALRRDLGLIAVPVVPTGARAHGFHGNLILVRDARIEAVHHLDLPGLEPRGLLMADLTIRGRPLRVIAAHLGLLGASRRRQAQALLDKLDSLGPRPSLLMGDLNEWRGAARSSLGGLSAHFDTAVAVPSFPSRFPLIALDRIMACTRGELSAAVAHDTPLARLASDHLPVKARLRLRADNAPERTAPIPPCIGVSNGPYGLSPASLPPS